MPLGIETGDSLEEMLKRQVERRAHTVVPAGDYYLKIIDAKDSVSKKGNDMVVIDFAVLDEAGDQLTKIREYITEKTKDKAFHILQAVDMEELWAAGNQMRDVILAVKEESRFVPARIKVEEYQHNGEDKEKNAIHFYIKPEEENYL